MEEKKNTFTLIFNDRAFEDNWAEPYVVKVTTFEPITQNELRGIVEEAIKNAENSEDGMLCSTEGIDQIFSYLPGLITSYETSQMDDNFQFGSC